MGKTTTIKLFTQDLLSLRDRGHSAPLPILFDLRELPPAVARAGAGLPTILTRLLGLSVGPSAEQVLDLVAGGDCVLIFDGLDEVLVHLDPYVGQMFTRTLWRATEDTWRSRPADRKPARPSKLLLSCRTHYFRTIRHETTHFTGQHRDGPVSADYLALLMLPFGEEQVRAYLMANLPGADVERLLELIDSVHNLREIAERPLTLRMVTEQLEAVERAKLAGRAVHAVDLYGSFVYEWLERDDGKHCLLPGHKELLMEHLAVELWRSGRTSWAVGDVEQWLLEFLHGRPDLELRYRPAPRICGRHTGPGEGQGVICSLAWLPELGPVMGSFLLVEPLLVGGDERPGCRAGAGMAGVGTQDSLDVVHNPVELRVGGQQHQLDTV